MVNINLKVIDECDSTNTYLVNLGKKGYPEGFSILTLNQKSGKGTKMKKWVSIPGNLFLSTLIRPYVNKQKWSQMSIIFGWSLFEYLLSIGVDKKVLSIKWPNDVMINSKKVAGILVETFDNFCVIGTGININSNPSKKQIGIDATSISDIIDTKEFILYDISLDLLNIFYKNYKIWLNYFLNPFLNRINSYLAYKNNIISFMHNNLHKSGKLIGINPEGQLKILLHNNKYVFLTSSESIVYSGIECF
tara:strand:- start:62 stop:805 length:744 start_codon:yes stop_codon:yes gene_type:complete